MTKHCMKTVVRIKYSKMIYSLFFLNNMLEKTSQAKPYFKSLTY